MMPAPLEINWYNLYRNRQELDRRWSNYPGAGLSADLSDDTPLEEKETPRAYEPKVTRISGHGDRCVSLRDSCASRHPPSANRPPSLIHLAAYTA